MKSSLRMLAVCALVAFLGVFFTRVLVVRQPLPESPQMQEAAARMADCLSAILLEKQRLGIPVDASLDWHGSGLIGEATSPITTTLGHLPSKRTGAGPDMAALCVRLLGEAGLKAGDSVGAVTSGSFPGLGFALITACEVLDLELVYTVSVGASSYGANQVALPAPAMMQLLADRGLITTLPSLITPGGHQDSGSNMMGWAFPEEAAAINALYKRMDIHFPAGYHDSILKRQGIFGRIACFVSIGGHDAAMGMDEAGYRLGQGLLQGPAGPLHPGSGLITRYLAQGIPVISLVNLKQVCAAHGLPYDPEHLPETGQSALYFRVDRPKYPAILALIACIALLIFYKLRNRPTSQTEEMHMNHLQYLLERASAATEPKRRLTLLLQALALLNPQQREEAESRLQEHMPLLTACQEALNEQDADSGTGILSPRLMEKATPEVLDQVASVLSGLIGGE